MPFRPEGLHLVAWALAAEAVLLVFRPGGRLGRILLAGTTLVLVAGLVTWGVMFLADW
jgi:hypothetical protein